MAESRLLRREEKFPDQGFLLSVKHLSLFTEREK